MTITLLVIGQRRARDAAVTIEITPHLIETGIKKGGLELSWMSPSLPVNKFSAVTANIPPCPVLHVTPRLMKADALEEKG